MNHMHGTSFAILILVATALVAQTTAAPPLQKGISVEMAVTPHAAPVPAADNEDAWIVAITANGSIYFGVDPVTPSELADKMKRRPRRRNQNLYIKSDALAPWAAARRVLTLAHDMGFAAPVLLTSQPAPATPGTAVAPMGLEVQIGPHSNPAAVVVQINAAQPAPTLQVNDQETPGSALQDTLKRLLQTRSDTPILVKTSGPVSFASVAQVIDTCHSIGAQVMISTPQL